MADYCSSCEDLKTNAPDFMLNGVTEAVCQSLINNTGLNGASTNCDDFNDMVDCLIGQLSNEFAAYDICDWKAFTTKLMTNLHNVFGALVCDLCGQWIALQNASYVGVATLWTDTDVRQLTEIGSPSTPAFNQFTEESNLPDTVLTPRSDYKGIVINNTTSVPLLVNATFNCSIEANNMLSATYIVITRDGRRIGQCPFIAPTTYDQQVAAEAFILSPGDSTTISYFHAVGTINPDFVGFFGGEGTVHTVLAADSDTDLTVQRSYLNVHVSSIVGKETTTS